MRFTAPMRPFSKARPRVSSRGTYMPRAYVLAREQLRAAMPRCEPLSGPVSLVCVFRCKGKGRCDVDNLAGAVMDAGNGVLWEDDRQIVQLTARIERHSAEENIEVEFSEIP